MMSRDIEVFVKDKEKETHQGGCPAQARIPMILGTVQSRPENRVNNY
jgi:hypothetical protein